MASPVIPSFYRLWFTVADPILSMSGVIGNVLAPETILNSYTPSHVSPPAPETTLLLDTAAGYLAGTAYLQLVLLPARSTDVPLWRAVQASILVVDLAILAGNARVLGVEGRMHWAALRWEEWVNLGITTFVAAVRSAFLFGVGLNEAKGKGKRV